MSTQVPPKRGEAYSLEVCLVSQASPDIFQTTVTLAAGDVVVYQDGVLDGNIDTLPTEIGASGVLVVTLSAAEMTADRVAVKFSDVAGAEWQDLLVNIHTVTTSQIDDLATATALATAQTDLDTPDQYKADVTNLDVAVSSRAVAGDTMTLVDDAITAAKYDESTAFPLVATDGGATQVARVGADGDTLETLSDQLDDVDADVWTYVTRTLTAFGAGAVEFTYMVTNILTGVPIEGVTIWITTDSGGANVVWAGSTDAFGTARDANNDKPLLDAGTYYVWKQRAGFTDDQNPDTEVVA